MEKKETLKVINEIINESTKDMEANAKALLSVRDWDYDMFGDRNTFARVVMEVLFENEIRQYEVMKHKRDKNYKSLKASVDYELTFIHN